MQSGRPDPPAATPPPPATATLGIQRVLASDAGRQGRTSCSGGAAPSCSTAGVPPATPAGPGEFTRLMQSGRPDPPPATPRPQPPAAGPSEFSRVMQARPPAPAPTGDLPWRHEKGTAPPPSGTSQPGGPGEFTRMFQAPPPAGPPLASLPSNPGSAGEFTRMMSTPSAHAENLFQPPTAREGDLFAPQPGGVARDEFSQVADGSRPAPPAPAAKPAGPAAAPKSKSGVLPIVLILGALVVLAIVLILVFAR